MTHKKLWMKCSAVAVSFYLLAYIFLAQLWGYFNPWLIVVLLVFAIADVWGLHWWIEKHEDEDSDEYP